MEGDPWLPEIARYVEEGNRPKLGEVVAKKRLDKVIAEEVMDELRIDLGRGTQADRNRVGRCLRQCGFVPGQWRNTQEEPEPGKKFRGYLRKV